MVREGSAWPVVARAFMTVQSLMDGALDGFEDMHFKSNPQSWC